MIRFEIVEEEHRKHNTDIRRPERSTENAAGYDFFSPEAVSIQPGEIRTVWTDVKARMDKNVVLMLYPRSSMGKHRVVLANGTGVIDGDYCDNPGNDGNIGFMLYNYGDAPYVINEGDKIGQGVFVPFYVTEDDVSGKKRTGGFGSTGV